MTTEEEDEVIRRRDSERGRHAVGFLWRKLRTAEERRERMAPVGYARLVKNRGTEAADRWLEARFGPEKAARMLATNAFRRQRIKYL